MSIVFEKKDTWIAIEMYPDCEEIYTIKTITALFNLLLKQRLKPAPNQVIIVMPWLEDPLQEWAFFSGRILNIYMILWQNTEIGDPIIPARLIEEAEQLIY